MQLLQYFHSLSFGESRAAFMYKVKMHLARRNTFYVLYFMYSCIHIAHRDMVHSSLSQEMSCNILIINILKIGSDLFHILFTIAMEIFPSKSIQVCQTNVVISSIAYCFPSTLVFYDTNIMSPNLATKLAPKCWTPSKNAFTITLIPLPRLTLKSMKASKFIINFCCVSLRL